MSLPHELVDHILNFLQSDLVTLKKCAQSHPIFSKFAERYIYAKIALYDNLQTLDRLAGLRTSEFAQIIAKKPNITNYVCRLAIYVDDEAEPEASHLNNVASMLPMFSRLEEITLSGFRTLSPISWHTLPGMFCQAFQHLLRVQSLKDVSILYVSCFPLSLLDKTLRVTLYNCRNVQYDEGSIEVQPLERLSIQHFRTLEKITSWVQMRSLRSLRVSLDQFEFREFLPPLLSACSSTLINLDLDIGQALRSSYGISLESGVEYQYTGSRMVLLFPFTLADLFHMERLTIFTVCALWPRGDGWDQYSPTPAITELISTAPPTLKQVFLEFTLLLQNLPDPDTAWAPLVPLVEKCSSLSITISVCAKFKIQDERDKYLCPSKIFSSLSGCGGLKQYVEKGVFVLIPEIE